jgi:hypothetical protein
MGNTGLQARNWRQLKKVQQKKREAHKSHFVNTATN